MSGFGWYGFDLDGTIADNTAHGFGMGVIGKPIPKMCERMRRLHEEGCDVRIFTARLSDVGNDAASQKAVIEHIGRWCDAHLGFRPRVVDRKDFAMRTLYDDRAKQVIRNTGLCLEDLTRELASCLREALRNGGSAPDAELRNRSTRLLAQCEKV